MLKNRVMISSVSPAAKIDWYPMLACGRSPRLTCTMYAVMVAPDSDGSNEKLGCKPPAMATTIVSPSAREIPRMYAAVTPDSDDGSTTLNAVCILVAPMAYDPSRMYIGTACMPSSDSELTYGMIITPITKPADSMLNPGRLGMNV